MPIVDLPTNREVGCGIDIQGKGLGSSKGQNIPLERITPFKNMVKCMGGIMSKVIKTL
jgi:hypothetical protein